MSELLLEVRDSVGINSTVILQGDPILIKDLPKGSYDLYHKRKCIGTNFGPNRIPGRLIFYATELEQTNYKFTGNSVPEKISNLEILALSNL
jgi:hypothetical protein